MREIPEEEYQQWSKVYNKAAATINGRGDALDKAAEMIERDLFLLGATAVEDKLQEGVPDTIYTLQQAGIKVWVLTGDRQETAINIGLSCRLISESMSLVRASCPGDCADAPAGDCERDDRPRYEGLHLEATRGRQELEKRRRL